MRRITEKFSAELSLRVRLASSWNKHPAPNAENFQHPSGSEQLWQGNHDDRSINTIETNFQPGQLGNLLAHFYRKSPRFVGVGKLKSIFRKPFAVRFFFGAVCRSSLPKATSKNALSKSQEGPGSEISFTSEGKWSAQRPKAVLSWRLWALLSTPRRSYTREGARSSLRDVEYLDRL